MKIAAIVVLYNPAINVYENLQTYKEDVDVIYVLDNSVNKNDKLVELLLLDKKCLYRDMKGNQGLAIALKKGCQEAKDNGYSYVLTMDQDSYFEDNAVRLLKAEAQKKKNFGIIAPNCKAVDENNKVMYIRHSMERAFIEVFWVMTSGCLMDLNIYYSCGEFDDCLFIGGIDIDIGIKIYKSNNKIEIVTNAFLCQHFGQSQQRKLLWKKVHPYMEMSEKIYYYTRNNTYLKKKYGRKIWKHTNVSGWKAYLKILLFEPAKIKKLKLMTCGVRDAKLGRMGLRRIK